MVGINNNPANLGSFSIGAVSDQQQNGNFSVTVTAKTHANADDTSFTGQAELLAVEREIALAETGFYNSYPFFLDSNGTKVKANRLQAIYTAAELGGAGASLDFLRINVRGTPGTLSIIFVFESSTRLRPILHRVQRGSTQVGQLSIQELYHRQARDVV